MKEHFDLVSISIQVTNAPYEQPLDDWFIVFDAKVDQLEVREFMLDQFPRPRDQLIITDKRTNVSWGASGAILEFVVQVGPTVGEVLLTGVAGNAAWDVIKGIGSRITRLWGNTEERRVDPLSDAEAAWAARRVVERRYGLEIGALEAESTSTDFETGRSVVTVASSGGSRYVVELVRNDSGVDLARVTHLAA